MERIRVLLSLSLSLSLNLPETPHHLPRATQSFFSPLPLPPTRLQLRSPSGGLLLSSIRTRVRMPIELLSHLNSFPSFPLPFFQPPHTPRHAASRQRLSLYEYEYAAIVQSNIVLNYTVVQNFINVITIRRLQVATIGLNGWLWLT